VWAIALRITSAHTLKAMKDLFRKCYHTRTQALSDLFRDEHEMRIHPKSDSDGNDLPPTTEQTQKLRDGLKAVGIFTLEEMQTFMQQSLEENKSSNKWKPEELDFIRKTAHELAHVSPEMFDIEEVLDFEGWFAQNSKHLGHHASFANISKAHQFGIEKQRGSPDDKRAAETGNTYLYNSFLATSFEDGKSRPEEQHHYPNCQTGSYSTRMLIFPSAAQLIEPIRLSLTRMVDAHSIKKMLNVFGQESLTQSECFENEGHLQRMQRGAEEQGRACPECAEIMLKLKKVGPISRKDNASSVEIAHRNAQTNEKNRLMTQYNDHIKDPAFAGNHDPLAQHRFWNAWVDRATIIQRDYLARDAAKTMGQALLQAAKHSPHPHPPHLCSDMTEPAIFPSLDRVDTDWLTKNGPPKVGHYAVVRAKETNDAFYLGLITKLHEDPQQQLNWLENRRDYKIRALQRTAAPGIRRMATPAVHPRLLALHIADPASRDEKMLQQMKELGQVEIQKRLTAIAGRGDRLNSTFHPCFEIRASHHASSGVQQPSSLGVFATRDIARGEFIDWYSAHATSVQDFRQNRYRPRSHLATMPNNDCVMDGYPTASALTRFVPHDEDSLARMKLMPASEFEPRTMYAHSALFRPEIGTLLLRFHELPKGCIINSAGTETKLNNCKREFHGGFSKTMLIDGVPFIVATSNIRKGEELLCPYKNHEERNRDWSPFVCAETLSLASEHHLQGSSGLGDDEAKENTVRVSVSCSACPARHCGGPPESLPAATVVLQTGMRTADSGGPPQLRIISQLCVCVCVCDVPRWVWICPTC
jgi:hypothetical protein